jgi:thioredoxin 1
MKKISYLLLIASIVTFASCNKTNEKREAAKNYLKDQTINYQESPKSSESVIESTNILKLTDDNFDKTISTGITIVDFWAVWCKPCQMQAPIIDELSVEMKDKIKFGKINIDENKFVPQRFAVESIPTMIIFKDGVLVDKLVGFTDKNTLAATLKKHI